MRTAVSERLPVIASSQPLVTKPRAIRVLHVHSGNMYGGIEAMMLTQVRQRELCPAMESYFALCFAGRLSEELISAGATVHWMGEARIRQPLSMRRARRRLGELLRREAFDVVVTHSSWSQAIFGTVARRANLPLVFYLHGTTNGRHWLERWASRTPPDLALSNSRFTAQHLPEIYPRTRAEVVYCPVAPPEHIPDSAERARTRAELQTPDDATVIIQVSRMEQWKGHALHLKALSLVRDVPGWVCWQVGGAQRRGEQEYLEELKQMARGLGIAERIRYLDQRSDVWRLLASADIYCQPNTSPEPFGLAFIEALYARLPVVTTAIGGACEIIDESCGALVQPEDAPALATALRRLIQEPALRTRLGNAGPVRARSLCDPATQMNQFSEALASVIHGRREGA